MFPYFGCSDSPRTTSPPPADTKSLTADISSEVSFGEPSPKVFSQSSSEACGITKTSTPLKDSLVKVPVWCERTPNPDASAESTNFEYPES